MPSNDGRLTSSASNSSPREPRQPTSNQSPTTSTLNSKPSISTRSLLPNNSLLSDWNESRNIPLSFSTLPTTGKIPSPSFSREPAQSSKRSSTHPSANLSKKDLLSGHSTVWVLVEGTDEEANETTYQQLEETLKKAQEKITIPEGVIQADQVGKVGADVSLDDVLRSTIPLKISFKIERVKRSDLAEQPFLRILTANRPSPPEEPLVVPIFGRGRTPGPLLGSTITPDTIMNACEYLCGACSCQVKSGNPGYDILFLANWREKLNSGLVVVDKKLPRTLPTLNDGSNDGPEDKAALNSPSAKFTIILIIGIGVILIIGTVLILKEN